MSFRAGAGSFRNVLICAAMILGSTIVRAEVISDEADLNVVWETQERITLEPGERLIALIQQNGTDLAVRIVADADNTDSYTQDGADERVGTEIVALENASDELASYHLQTSKINQNTESKHTAELIRNPSDRDFTQAQRYSEAAQRWMSDAAASTSSLLDWKAISLDSSSSFQEGALVNYLTGLKASYKCDESLAFLANNYPNRSPLTFYDYYLLKLEAECHMISGNNEQGAGIYKMLVDNSDLLDTTFEQQITLSEVLAAHGSGLVIQGFNASDVSSIVPGGELIEQALVLSESLNDPELTGNITSSLAMYQAMSGDWESGIKSLYIAESLLEKSESYMPLAVVKNNIAYHYMRQGLIGDAQQVYRDQLLFLDEHPEIDMRQFIITYARLALTYKTTGDYSKAENYFNFAADLYSSVEDELNLIDTKLELGEILRLRGRYDEAIKQHQELLPLIEAESWNDGWIRLRIQLAESHMALGQQQQAHSYVDELIAHRESKRSNGEEASRVPAFNMNISALSARLAIQNEEWQLAQTELLEALSKQNSPLQESEQQLELIHLLSLSQYGAGQLQEALDTGRDALNLINSVRDQVDIRRQGATWNNRVSYISSRFIRMLLEEYIVSNNEAYFLEAFDTLQRTRSISLRQSQQLSLHRDNSDQSRVELESLWQTMIRDKQALLASSVQHREARTIESRAIRSEEIYNAYQINPSPEDLPALTFVTLDEVKSNLQGTNTSALLFVLDEEFSYGIEVTADSHKVYPMPGLEQLAVLIEDSLTELTSLNDTNDKVAVFELSQHIFPAIDSRSTNIIVEAGGILDQLPLAALPEPEEEAYLPVGLSRSFVNVPSLSAYFKESPERNLAAERVQIAILADPEFSSVEVPFGLESTEVAPFEQWRSGLGRLPYTAVEAARIISKFPEDTARSYTGVKATVENLFSPEVRNSRVLHLASHGFSSDQNPNHVGFLLASNPENPESGFLTTESISNYYFDVELIVISGCETASGEVFAGEGMMGLSRAFLAQGGKSVLATLWPVSDRATALFMEHFYSALITEELPSEEALHQAQLKMFQDPLYNKPVYWAAFALTVSNQSATPVQSVL